MSEAEFRQRSVYLSLRLKVLREEIASLGEEQKTVRTALREMTDRKSADAKTLKQKRIYTEIRLSEAKSEVKNLSEEKKALAVALGRVPAPISKTE